MPFFSRRQGRIAIQAIVVSSAALVGGVSSIPWMIKSADKGSLVPAVSSHEMSLVPHSDVHSEPSAALPGIGSSFDDERASTEPHTLSPTVTETTNPATSTEKENRNSDSLKQSRGSRGGEIVRVYYATDRQLYRASNPHLWITTISPSLLAISITCVMTAGCFVGKRRWAWGIGTVLCVFLSYVLIGETVIQVGQLVRLAQDGNAWFGGGRYEASNAYPLHVGTCDVSLPPFHQRGVIERPSVFSFEFHERADRHIIVERIQPLATDDFFAKLRERISASGEASALIYIHGYNVQFDEGLHRTAQLSKDIGFAGAPILYSWPSHGQLLKYRKDEANVEWSVAHLERFLTDIHQRTGVKKLHVIAHSMGNRALVGAMQLLQARSPNAPPMLNQVVLAAPDIDADVFRDRYAGAVDAVAQRATLYASATDRALLASMRLHGHRRLGLTSPPQPTVLGVDLIDVTPVDTSLLGHSYYGSHPLMIRELISLIHSESRPEDRHWLTTLADRRIPPLWKFVPELAAQASASY